MYYCEAGVSLNRIYPFKYIPPLLTTHLFLGLLSRHNRNANLAIVLCDQARRKFPLFPSTVLNTPTNLHHRLIQIVGFVKSMKDLDSLTGVRLTAILPGLVNTPILTSEKVKQLSITEKRSLSPDTVAVAMLDLLQKREYPSGTNLAISMAGTQVIPDWGVQPPTAAGTGQDVTGEEMVKAMLAPVEEVLRGERKARL